MGLLQLGHFGVSIEACDNEVIGRPFRMSTGTLALRIAGGDALRALGWQCEAATARVGMQGGTKTGDMTLGVTASPGARQAGRPEPESALRIFIGGVVCEASDALEFCNHLHFRCGVGKHPFCAHDRSGSRFASGERTDGMSGGPSLKA
jgi:hypothetical protein